MVAFIGVLHEYDGTIGDKQEIFQISHCCYQFSVSSEPLRELTPFANCFRRNMCGPTGRLVVYPFGSFHRGNDPVWRSSR